MYSVLPSFGRSKIALYNIKLPTIHILNFELRLTFDLIVLNYEHKDNSS